MRQFTDDLAETEYRLKSVTFQRDRLREWAQKLSDRACCTVIGGGHGGLHPSAHCHSDDLIGLRACLAYIADDPDAPALDNAAEIRATLERVLAIYDGPQPMDHPTLDQIRAVLARGKDDDPNDVGPFCCPYCGESNADKLAWGEGKEGEVHCHSCGRYYTPDAEAAAEEAANDHAAAVQEGAPHVPEHETIDNLRAISKEGSGWGYAKPVRELFAQHADLRRRLAGLVRAVDLKIKSDAFAGGPNRLERESADTSLRTAFRDAKRGGV